MTEFEDVYSALEAFFSFESMTYSLDLVVAAPIAALMNFDLPDCFSSFSDFELTSFYSG
jgi:hypothetical protein